ncbi:MAG: hypothetical protein K0Q96_834 [Rubrobacteraceae bacterium]|nr:hypothetical protein [Rubrobacteraceae bacterium]
MVLGAEPGTAVVAPARHDGRLVKGVDGGAVVCGERDVDGVARIAPGDPEVRLASPPEPRCRDAGLHDKLVAKRGEGFLVEALAPLEVRHGKTDVVQHRSHLPNAQETQPTTSAKLIIPVLRPSTTASFLGRLF